MRPENRLPFLKSFSYRQRKVFFISTKELNPSPNLIFNFSTNLQLIKFAPCNLAMETTAPAYSIG